MIIWQLRGACQNPQVFPARLANHHGLVVFIQGDDPVIALGDGGQQLGDPAVETHLEFGIVGAGGYPGGALCFAGFLVLSLATVDHAYGAVLIEGVGGGGIVATALEPLGQAGDFIPGAAVALQVHLVDGGQGLVSAAGAQQAGKEQGEQSRYQSHGDILFVGRVTV